MGIARRITIGAVLFVMAVGTLRSGDDKDVRATIAKAIRAKGGDHEAKYKGTIMKAAGTFHGAGEGIPFTGEWQVQGNKQSRAVLEIKVMNQTLTVAKTVNGDKGWMKFNDQVKDMSADELAEEKDDLYARWVSSLVPLKDKAFKLAPLGEVKIDDKAATGVRVSREGKRDVNLYFDNGTGMLVKTEHQVKDVAGGGDKEVLQETYFSDFKDFKGAKYPTKFTIKREGKLYVEGDVSDIRPVEMIEAAVFARP
jgi:hypothetical protein